jgi:hypothetical protein
MRFKQYKTKQLKVLLGAAMGVRDHLGGEATVCAKLPGLKITTLRSRSASPRCTLS